MLQARGVPHTIASDRGAYVLLVPYEQAERARDELARYEAENHAWPPREESQEIRWRDAYGSVVYVALLVLAYFFERGGALGYDWRSAGAGVSSLVVGSEPWRAITSLFLHVDVPHVASNVVFGAVFGLLVAQLHGSGAGWLSILLAGALGNVGDAALRGEVVVSIGASTAVFGAMGIYLGSEWRRRLVRRESFVRRLAPLLVGVVLYSFLGVGGERTNIVAHFTGMVSGVPLGMALAALPPAVLASRGIQLALGAAALGLSAGAWFVALGAGS